MSLADRLDPLRAWVVLVAAILAILVVGSIALPRVVYDRFVWAYFWGPVVADANGAVCAVRAGGAVDLLGSTPACTQSGGIVAYPGYTLVSEVGYAVTLLLAVVGVVFLLRALDIGQERRFFFALVPYMFLGGALRVVEDANDAVPAGTDPAISFPLNTLLISPVIYFTMFAFTLAALLVAIWLDRSGVVSGYERPLAGAGTLGLVAVTGYLLWLAATTTYVGFFPQIAVVVLVLTALITVGMWVGIDRLAPHLHRGTGSVGVVVIWGHALDGVANVVGIDWGAELGLPYGDLVPKHPVNRALIDVGERFPAALTDVIGTAWPFLVVKLVAVVFILYIFDEEIFEDSPRFTMLLLVAIVAVGLGPGTRDMLRATFGI